jgi:hypothetical protein
MPTTNSRRPRRTTIARRAGQAAIHVATVLLILSVPAAAFAAPPKDPPGTDRLTTVIGNLQHWIIGILIAVATLFGVLAGVYWATAGGDPAQVDKAKSAFKNACVGYGLAILAPVFLGIVKSIVGG